MEENKMQKPFVVAMDDAKLEIVQSVSNAIQVHGLPISVVEMIVADVYAQVRDASRQELAMAKEHMKNDSIANNEAEKEQ